MSLVTVIRGAMSHGLCFVLGPHRFVDLFSCNVLETLKVMAVSGHLSVVHWSMLSPLFCICMFIFFGYIIIVLLLL